MRCTIFLIALFATRSIFCAPIGLKNLGNTCYMNATIQALLNTPEFAKDLNSVAQKTPVSDAFIALNNAITIEKGKKSTLSLEETLTNFYTQIDTLFYPTTASKIFNDLNNLAKPSDYVEKKIEETLKRIDTLIDESKKPNTLFLAKIQSEIAKTSEHLTNLLWINDGLIRGDALIDMQKTFLQKHPRSFSQQDASEFCLLFFDNLGQAEQNFRKSFGIIMAEFLDNKKKMDTTPPEILLSLPLAPGWDASTYQSTQAALNNFCSIELVEWQGRNNVPKQLLFQETPPLLIVHLKRFVHRYIQNKLTKTSTYESKRISDPITPTSPLIFSQKTHGVDAQYDLEAIVVQYGTLEGGHYTAYIKSYEDGKWYFCDDSFIYEIGTTLRSNGHTPYLPNSYLLFYRQIDPSVVALSNLSKGFSVLTKNLTSKKP